MKTLFPFALIACVAAASAARAADVTPPLAATAPVQAASVPSQSPAVRQAQTAIAPGKVRPENAVVPQIRLPLRPAVPGTAPASDVAPPPALDERAARCAALVSQAERLRCEAGS